MKLSQKYNQNNSQKPTDRPTKNPPVRHKKKQTKIHECGERTCTTEVVMTGKGRVNGALQTCMKFHEIPKNKSNQKAHQTGKPINRNSNNYNNLSSSYVWAKSFISILWHNTRIEFFLPFISKETQTWKLYINCLWLHFLKVDEN